MRHQVFGRKLNRDVKERKALFRNLTTELILHGKIHTTYAKAKAVIPFVERLVTYAKKEKKSLERYITKHIINKEISDKLLQHIAPVFKDITGGYTRIRKTGNRTGDGAAMVLIEWSREIRMSEQKKGRENDPKKKSVTKLTKTAPRKSRKAVKHKKI